jgi:acyl-coenzyme A synthetase/AMP-(fatty) acid ligase
LLTGVDVADLQAVWRMYTSSGTTGQPRVIGQTGADLESMTTRALALEPLTRGPNLCMMWLSTIGGFGSAHTTLWHGATLVLATAPLMVLRSINLYRVAFLRASPQQLGGLLKMLHARPVRFPSLEKIEIGGASTPRAVLLGARATLCPNVIGIYGSTEAGLVAQAPAAILHAHPDAAGYVVPDVQVRIVDDSGHPVASDVEGLVQVRTPYMAKGYIGDHEATAASFRDGWFLPGDLGVLGADGLLRITGRADEMINAGGVKLNPASVDEFLLSQPGVRDAATFAFRQSGRSDQVWAAVVCDEHFDEHAVLAAARARLDSRAPKRLLLISEIPRNAMGKPMRQKLSKDALAI